MKPGFIIAIILISLAFLYIIGGFIGEFGDQCSEINGCRKCWSLSTKIIQPGSPESELCPNPNEPCEAEPYIQQHNAVVDVLTCACEKTKAANYQDMQLNKKIASTYNASTNQITTASELCDNPSYLTKWMYG